MAQPPRQRDAGLAIARQQRPQHQHRGAHLAHQIVGCRRRFGMTGDQGERPLALAGLIPADDDAELRQQIAHRGDIGQARQVAQDERGIGQQAGGHKRQPSILRAADGNDAIQRPAADDPNSIHAYRSFIRYCVIGGIQSGASPALRLASGQVLAQGLGPDADAPAPASAVSRHQHWVRYAPRGPLVIRHVLPIPSDRFPSPLHLPTACLKSQ